MRSAPQAREVETDCLAGAIGARSVGRGIPKAIAQASELFGDCSTGFVQFDTGRKLVAVVAAQGSVESIGRRDGSAEICTIDCARAGQMSKTSSAEVTNECKNSLATSSARK